MAEPSKAASACLKLELMDPSLQQIVEPCSRSVGRRDDRARGAAPTSDPRAAQGTATATPRTS